MRTPSVIYDRRVAEPDSSRGSGRPAAPTTAAELERSIRILWIAIAAAIATIVAVTVVSVTVLDAPAVPLVPIAALVVVVDVVFVVAITRQRRRALGELRRREAGAS